ncbi:hypothetical protein PBRA_007665 [Plasmodiophora brassicae]|uniref:Uncharacterized protein n=1 Tax=Plasmodiophora brassicae TaxID=37360 RepID=A0A0G4IXY1_PLABS|nr:hypothetical protein PBRA_007665 [Plasmodiophora brassicae]
MTYFRSQCVEAGGSGGLRTEVVGQLRGVVRLDVSAGRASMQEGAPIVSRAYELGGGGARVDPARNRFPFCLVWGPLPIISWILPFIGHLGITDSQGRIHDFAGPFYIGIDQFMVGAVTRYYRIDPRSCSYPNLPPDMSVAEAWDAAIEAADSKYRAMMHNIVTNNCHHHCSQALRNMGKTWSMFYCWILITFKGRFVSPKHFIQSYIGFFILTMIIVIISALAR